MTPRRAVRITIHPTTHPAVIPACREPVVRGRAAVAAVPVAVVRVAVVPEAQAHVDRWPLVPAGPCTPHAPSPAVQAAPTAPVIGVISSDNSTIYVGTTGDNLVHLINRTTLTDDPTKTISPGLLQNINGFDQPNTTAPPDLLVQHPKRLQS